ncbi:hypothetical protein RN11_2652 [Mycobacterium tuberculosis]|nr:hypothetical protein RN11_2652 [Mycobacterium tuberculosis]
MSGHRKKAMLALAAASLAATLARTQSRPQNRRGTGSTS